MELSPLQKRSIFKINPVEASSEENFKLLDEESCPMRQGWSVGNKKRLRGSNPPHRPNLPQACHMPGLHGRCTVIYFSMRSPWCFSASGLSLRQPPGHHHRALLHGLQSHKPLPTSAFPASSCSWPCKTLLFCAGERSKSI